MRTQEQVESLLNEVDTAAVVGPASRWPGMTYEQGVDAALRWVLEDTDVSPLED